MSVDTYLKHNIGYTDKMYVNNVLTPRLKICVNAIKKLVGLDFSCTI